MNEIDFWFEKWMKSIAIARAEDNLEIKEIVSRHAVICQMEYRCRKAQEWAGARK